LSAEQVRASVTLRKWDVASCYPQDTRGAGPQKIELALLLEPDGRVAEANVTGGRRGFRTQAECIELKARSWRFPAVTGDGMQELRIPFVVVPGAGT
jgi:hypothetical protein